MDLALSLIKGLDEEALGMLLTTATPALQVCYYFYPLLPREGTYFTDRNCVRCCFA